MCMCMEFLVAITTLMVTVAGLGVTAGIPKHFRVLRYIAACLGIFIVLLLLRIVLLILWSSISREQLIGLASIGFAVFLWRRSHSRRRGKSGE